MNLFDVMPDEVKEALQVVVLKEIMKIGVGLGNLGMVEAQEDLRQFARKHFAVLRKIEAEFKEVMGKELIDATKEEAEEAQRILAERRKAKQAVESTPEPTAPKQPDWVTEEITKLNGTAVH